MNYDDKLLAVLIIGFYVLLLIFMAISPSPCERTAKTAEEYYTCVNKLKD